MEYGFLSIVPPVLAIILALAAKNVYIALFSSLFAGYTIVNGFNILGGFDGMLTAIIQVFADSSNTMIIIACGMLTGLTYTIEKVGGIAGLVKYLTEKRSIIKTKRGSLLFTWILGMMIFITSSVNCLVTGTVTHSINDSMKVSREKQALFVHSVALSVCVLIPLNGWGAGISGTLQATGVADGMATVVGAIPLNFFCLLAVIVPLLTAIFGKDFGPMKKAEELAARGEFSGNSEIREEVKNSKGNESAADMVIPIATMIITLLGYMTVSGGGNLLKGNGMGGVMWGVSVAIIVAGILFIGKKKLTFDTFMGSVFKGIGNFVPFMVILTLAFAMGTLVKTLGAGNYLAEIAMKFMSPALLPALAFLISAIISFSTGTSLGTIMVMMPLLIPVALTVDMNVSLVTGAILGGSLFGDMSSPISDSTAITCSSTECDPVAHIRTLLPYTLTYAVITFVLYIVVGFIM